MVLNISMTEHKPNILYWDIESTTIDILYRTYDLRVGIKRFDPDTIERDWSILSIAWAMNDEPVKCIGVSPKNPKNDYEIVRAFHAVLDSADYIVGHNMDSFDLKKFNTRALVYKLPPIGKKNSIDTLKLARKHWKFTSNKLSYIADYLGIEAKDSAPDWNACLAGDADALAYMRKYNKQDVEVTRQLYKRLAPYHITHPDMNVKSPVRDVAGHIVKPVCTVCQSPNTRKRGFEFRRKTKIHTYSCNDCGARFS